MKISIPQPCHESWNEMLQAEKGRFCQSCRKCVTDFMKMSDEEILEIIQQPNQCGRFSHKQLERINLKLEQKNKTSFPSIFRYSALIIGLGGAVFGQEICTPIVSVEQIKTEYSESVLNDSIIIIEGNIYDSDGFPVYQTRIGIKSNRNYTKNTDINGYFKLEIPNNIKFNKLFVDSEYGYGEYEIQYGSNQNLKIVLENYTVVKESIVLGGMIVEGTPIKQHKSLTEQILHTLAWPFRQIGKLF